MKRFFCFFILCLLSASVHALERGISIHSSNLNGSPKEFMSLIDKYNFETFRIDYSWDNLERKKNTFSPVDSYKNVEDLIYLAHQQGIKPLLVLDYGNKLYNIKKPISDKEIDLFCRYVKFVVSRFKGNVSYYEIWNEWSMPPPHYINRGYKSALDYVNLVKKVSQAIRREDPNAIILAGGFNPTSPDDQIWGENIIKLGILNYVDGVSIHPYLYRGRRDISSALIDYELLKRSYARLTSIAKRDIDIYVTEIGVPNSAHSNFNEEQVKDFYFSYMSYMDKLSYIKGVWWYDFIDDGANPNDDENRFGILHQDLTEKIIATYIKKSFSK